MTEQDTRAFWATHPCGEELIGGAKGEYETFFAEYDRFRYTVESHIPRCLDAITFAGRDVLEIGLGLGADSEQIIRRGGRWTGIDLTPESVERVKRRLDLRGLPYEGIVSGTVLDLPFPDRNFDVVFSHGVLHHVPDLSRAQTEIARVLRPTGEAVIMVYAKHSLNYLLSIAIARRLGLLAIYGLSRAGISAGGIYGVHVENAREAGILSYLRLDNFIHRNTDGPRNPYSRVFSLSDVRREFPSFQVTSAHKEFMHAPPLPVHRLRLARIAGWHLWVRLRPAPDRNQTSR
jgi:SAM-dependent methyltransferase